MGDSILQRACLWGSASAAWTNPKNTHSTKMAALAVNMSTRLAVRPVAARGPAMRRTPVARRAQRLVVRAADGDGACLLTWLSSGWADADSRTLTLAARTQHRFPPGRAPSMDSAALFSSAGSQRVQQTACDCLLPMRAPLEAAYRNGRAPRSWASHVVFLSIPPRAGWAVEGSRWTLMYGL